MNPHTMINQKIEEETKNWTLEDYKAFAYDRLYDELARDVYWAESFNRSQADWSDYVDSFVPLDKRRLG